MNNSATQVHGLVKWNLSPGFGIVVRPEIRNGYTYSADCYYSCEPIPHRRLALSVGAEVGGGLGAVLGVASAAATFLAVLASIRD